MSKSTCALSLPNHYLAAGLGVHLQVRGDCGDGVLDLEEVALHLGRVRVRARARVRVRDKVRVRVRVRVMVTVRVTVRVRVRVRVRVKVRVS